MTIIILSSSANRSGGLRQAVYLAEALQKRGCAVHFVCPEQGGAFPFAQAHGLACTPLPQKIQDVNRVLRGLMPGKEPVVVHAFHNRGVKAAAYLGTLWHWQGLPVVCAAHRGVTSRPKNPLPYLLPGIRAFLVNSEACGRTLPLLWRKKRCFVVNNSIPAERLLPSRTTQQVRDELHIPADHIVIGNVTNNNPLKGMERLLRIYAKARASLPPSTLTAVGVTPERWLPLSRELGIAEHCRFVPPTDHVADYMQLLSLLVFPSTFIESQPNVIVEAISLDVPVIANNIGGTPELLPADCLFDAENENEATAKLVKVFALPETLPKLREMNQAKKALFTTEYRVRTILGHYERILAERSLLPTENAAAQSSSL